MRDLLDLSHGAILNGKYQIDRLLAEGGMSEIFLGHPIHGAGMVAIKRMRLSSAADLDEDLRQFRAEYEILSALSHPALPHVLDFFEEDGRHYLVEEFVPGEALEQRMERVGQMTWDEAKPIVLALLKTLEFLHKQGLIYRDLKPSNVLVTYSGDVRLIDLGAARRWKKGATRDTIPLGTPGFAPPEQYGSAQTDERSDVYSVGALTHFLLTGVEPGSGEPWQFKWPGALQPGIPVGISHAIVQAVRLDRAERFPSTRAMRVRLMHPDEAPQPPKEAILRTPGSWVQTFCCARGTLPLRSATADLVITPARSSTCSSSRRVSDSPTAFGKLSSSGPK